MTVHPHILHNGRFIGPEAAVIPVFASALTGALGVYETILARKGRLMALSEHLERMEESARGAQIVLPVEREQLAAWCRQVVTANAPDGLLRVLALDLGGPTADVFIYEMAYTAPSPAEYEEGVAVAVYHGERAMPQVKSLNTLVPGLARKAAQAAGVHDALLVDRFGCVTEGSNCNVFVVMAGTLLAPPPGTILEGTVMTRVIRLAAELAIPFRRRPLLLADLPLWDEAFLTSTRRGVLPIHRVGEHVLGRPGPITQKLLAAYRAWEAAAWEQAV